MNRAVLRKFISAYKKEFTQIHKKEIYKWRAVKQFQDTWNPNAQDFGEMLSVSLSEANNLLDAGHYWPRRMILSYAQHYPQDVKKIFLDLFNEETDIIQRISDFQTDISQINIRLHPEKNTYQDYRAVLVYLNLKYPDVYFFYKYKMFKSFCEKIGYEYTPKLHSTPENVVQFLNLCTLIREELLADNELLNLHKDRLTKSEYFDVSGNILTQDFIYAVAIHLTQPRRVITTSTSNLELKQVDLKILPKLYKFSGKYVDYISRQRRNKFVGDLGEQIVMKYEKKHCPPNLASKVAHLSKSEGDGLGFDILSYDKNGQEKHIEVKATKGGASSSFYISGTELQRSKLDGNKYFLYRLFNLDEENMSADFFIIQGDLSEYCINPTQYEVILTKE